MKYFFILNEGSQGGKSGKTFPAIFSAIKSHGFNYDFGFTKTLNHAYDLSLKANRSGYDVIVAVGGDGTVNKVINGFFDEKGKRISHAKLGIIYTGTSPDICMQYSIPIRDLEASLTALKNGETCHLELGKIVLSTHAMPTLSHKPVTGGNGFRPMFFVGCANIGFGVMVARESGIRKYLGDLPGTLFTMLKSIVRYHASDQVIAIDGKEQRIHRAFNITIGKIDYVASGIKVANTLKKGDKRFYGVILKNLSIVRLPALLRSIYSGKPLKNTEQLSMHYGKVFEIYGNNVNPEVEFDGDPQGFLPCRIEMAEETLDLIAGGCHEP